MQVQVHVCCPQYSAAWQQQQQKVSHAKGVCRPPKFAVKGSGRLTLQPNSADGSPGVPNLCAEGGRLPASLTAVVNSSSGQAVSLQDCELLLCLLACHLSLFTALGARMPLLRV